MMATVELTFTALPVHVRTARLIVTAVARRSGVEESLLDEVRLAVGEACSQAVEVQRRNSPEEPVRLFLRDGDARFEVVVMGGSGDGDVTSVGGGAAPAVPAVPVEPPQPLDPIRSDDPSSGLARAVIAGLADDVEFTPTESGRLRIRMSWPTAEARQRAG
jgi:serine/threonine-protein kinase RsbW